MRTTSLHMIANINANDCQHKCQRLPTEIPTIAANCVYGEYAIMFSDIIQVSSGLI